jgi:hypothetical protein
MNRNLEAMLDSHLRVLVEKIGERPGGSLADHRAARYIAQTFAQAGLDVEEQRFDCPQWIHRNTSFIRNGHMLEAAANAYSPACDVLALPVGAGTVAELETAELRGCFAILYGDLIPAPLSPKSWFLITEREEKIIHLLEEKEPAAVLTVQNHRGGLERLIEDWEFLIPSATITPQTALALLQAPGQKAHLRIDSEQKAGYSANIVARTLARPSTVVLCAHFDTKFDTPGALDNGSGVAALLALAQILDATNYPFALEFVAFTNEEYLPLGDDEYLRRRQNLDDVTVAINMDSIGQKISANSIASFSASADFEDSLKQLTPAYPGVVWVDPWPQSNHSTFAMRGVPAVAFSSTGRIELAHWPDDDLRWIDLAKVGDVVRLIHEILTQLAEYPPTWSRE